MNPCRLKARPRPAAPAIAALAAMLAWLATAGGPAFAQSGDFPVSLDATKIYTVPEADCDTIQTAAASEIELILACSIGNRPANPGPDATPCDLIGGDGNVGVTLGQCLTASFPTPALAVSPDATSIEENTGVQATAAGLNLALSRTAGDFDQISVTSVGTGGGTVLGLVEVEAGACPGGGCPTSCGGVAVRPDTSGAVCETIRQALASSVTAAPPALSHALLLDIDQTGSAGLLNVAVCQGYRWSCATPGAPQTSVTYKGQIGFSVVNTPATTCLSRTGCICLTNCTKKR